MKKLQHRNVVVCLDIVLDDKTQTYGLVLELMRLGSVPSVQVRPLRLDVVDNGFERSEAATGGEAASCRGAEHRRRRGDGSAVPAQTKRLPSRPEGRQRPRRRRLHRQGTSHAQWVLAAITFVVQISDMGLSRFMDESTSSLHRASRPGEFHAVGTLDHIPPEKLRDPSLVRSSEATEVYRSARFARRNADDRCMFVAASAC